MHAENIPYGICQCGTCGRKTEIITQNIPSIGWVKGQPKRFIHGHQSRKPGPKYEVVDLGYTTPCWRFLGYVGKKGYGSIRPHGSKTMRAAHIHFYEQAKGPVPEGLQLDHLCRNRACVNPDHLEPVTNTENGRRGRRPTLTLEQVRVIRSRPKTYGSGLALAEEFGVHPSTIYNVRNRTRGWVD